MNEHQHPPRSEEDDAASPTVMDAGRRAAVRKLAYATPAVAAVMLTGTRAADAQSIPSPPSDPFGDN